MLNAFHEQAAGVPAVTFDIETTGLSPIDHQISLIGLGVPAKSGFQCWIFDVQAEAKLQQRHSKTFGREATQDRAQRQIRCQLSQAAYLAHSPTQSSTQ